MLFTRDLRTHDHPALAEAARVARHVVPLFVLDDAILRGAFAPPNRRAFLWDALEDLRASLQRLGADLVVRRGEVVREVLRVVRSVHAGAVFVTADVSMYAQGRERALDQALTGAGVELRRFPGETVVPFDELQPAGGDHYRVFTPYARVWHATPWRPLARRPRRLLLPAGLRPGALPARARFAGRGCSPGVPRGGETEARRRWQRWRSRGVGGYPAGHDDLAGDCTSRLSPYVHFGCLSPLELALDARDRAGGDAFVRQLCWRDFHHQVAAAFPRIGRDDYRPRGHRWRGDGEETQAWRDGCTGYPIVDAGMRQLRAEGWMHNRARLIVASFLVKDLGVDWRIGAAHFDVCLVDGDIANNYGNWQWVAGTGNDTRPNRVLNPLRQAERFDPSGDYVRRYVPELAGVAGRAVHRPWTLDENTRATLDYPDRIVDHDDVVAALLRGRPR